MKIFCLRGVWESWNTFIPEGSISPIKVNPYGWLEKSDQPIGFPFPCFVLLWEYKRRGVIDGLTQEYSITILLEYLEITPEMEKEIDDFKNNE